MDETANTLEAHIDRTRERLGSNLRELEDKVDAATDWRQHFRDRPFLFLGAALAGGAVLGAALRRMPATRDTGDVVRRVAAINGPVHDQAWDLWNNLQGALFGVAAARITGYISELIPGFADHYRQAEQRSTGDPTTAFRAR